MAFRTLEISHPTEIHVNNGQLLLYQKFSNKRKTNKPRIKLEYEGLENYEKIVGNKVHIMV